MIFFLYFHLNCAFYLVPDDGTLEFRNPPPPLPRPRNRDRGKEKLRKTEKLTSDYYYYYYALSSSVMFSHTRMNLKREAVYN